jgi:hypothetical protein
MSVNTAQTLTVLHPRADCLYEWTLSGGGSLSASQGNSVVYTAPATNPNCTNNATITVAAKGRLGCKPKGGTVCDTANIAVNASDSENEAYVYKVCINEIIDTYYEGRLAEYCPVVGYMSGKCNGTESMYDPAWNWCGAAWCDGLVETCEGWCVDNGFPSCAVVATKVGAAWPSCNPGGTRPEALFEAWDTRDAWLKSQGCCPSKLL